MTTSSVQFIASPYETGVSVREDIARNLLKIVAYGRLAYNELGVNESVFIDGELEITGISDITSAVLISEHLYKNNAWEYRNPNADYSCESFDSEDGGPQSFNFQYLEILDRFGKRVISASKCFEKVGLKWEMCIVSESKKYEALEQMKVLAQQASEERRGDNYDSVRWLNLNYCKLLSRVVSSRYNRQAIVEELERASTMTPKALNQILSLALAKSNLATDDLPF